MNKINRKAILLMVLCLIVVTIISLSCKKDTNPPVSLFKIEKESEKLEISVVSVKIDGKYDYPGKINSIKVRLGTNEQLFGSSVFECEFNERKEYSVEISGLRSGTKYHYRYEVDYGAKEDYLTDISDFTTQSESPTVRTIEIQAIDSTTFRVKCEVVAEGGQEVIERGICFNTYGDPTMDDEMLQHTTSGMGQYTIRMENLPTNTKYYVRAYAKNGTGIGFGDVLDFKTGGETTKPQVSTVEVSSVSYNTATCLSNVSSDGGLELTERGVCWGLEPDPTVNVHKVPAQGTETGNYTVTIEGLNPNTDYHVRAYAINEKGIAYGEDLPFTTTDGKPSVTTSAVTDITATSATGGGNVTDEGASPVTERGICWSTNHEPTINGSHVQNGTGAGSYSCNMSNLVPNETYYVRAYATNSQGTAYGAEVEFTAREGMPVVVTLDVTNITSTSAKAHGKVSNQGGSTVTERGICWGTEPSPTISGSHAHSGTGAGEYTVDMTSLAPGTKYYVRAYAINAQGMTYGGQEDFTTEATVPTVATGSINGTTVSGEVTSEGGATVTERGVCWSTSHTPTLDGSHGSSGSGLGTFSVELTDLAPGTTYYVRAYATNSAGTAYGSEKTLTTEANLPTVTTGEVTNIGQNTAQGSGNVTDGGGATVTERGICWSTIHNPTISGSHANSGTGVGGFTVSMTGLTANTHYYVRAYAKNSVGVSYGNEMDFTTSQSISAPTVTTSQVTNITQTTAKGGGNVTSDGGATVTERGICWGTSHNPTTSGSHASNGMGTGSYTVNMTGLTPGTQYYVRAYAINIEGASYGSEVSFTTQQPTTYTITVSANPTNGGMVSGGGTYQQGQSCTVMATTNNGYAFVNWTENGNAVFTNANYTFIVTGNRTLVANFNYNGGGNAPQGAINGLFTINASGDKVYFSQGNLQYIGSASTPYWKFADHQWDCFGTTTGQNSTSQTVDRDLFGWGTSDYNHGAVCYYPWSVSSSSSDYYAYGEYTCHLFERSGLADWGHNAISNGGNLTGQWRTLRREEWSYILDSRNTPSNQRFAKARVNGVDGIVILPDNWSSSVYVLDGVNQGEFGFSSNVITPSEWVIMESYGAVFLPAIGFRINTTIYNTEPYGSYWSSSFYNQSNAYSVIFSDTGCNATYSSSRSYGQPVRLVQDAE